MAPLDADDDDLSRVRRQVGAALRWASQSTIALIAIGAVLGLVVAPAATSYVTTQPTDTVAVVGLEGSINGQTASSVGARLKAAREDPDVEAVVLRVNSGGGSAPASESIYMAVKRTAAEMPVVVSVGGIAASGAYYASVPADQVFVTPSSYIGSVGVFFVAPADTNPIDLIVTTGPSKLSGNNRRGWEYSVEESRQSFVSAIERHRGQRLTISTRRLSYARLYSGARGVSYGLADRAGNLQDAISHAASLANLDSYRVRRLAPSGNVTYVTQTAYVASDRENATLASPSYFLKGPSDVEVPTLLMLPWSVVREGVHDEVGLDNRSIDANVTANATGVTANGTAAP